MNLPGLMHVCLHVDEILRLIARELVVPGAKGTAVALACCCKSFEDPVLDTLWETQTRLFHLLKSCPGVIWDEGRWAVSAPTAYHLFPLNCLILKRLESILTTRELDRFGKYARRMRKLHDNHCLPVEALSLVQQYTADEPLLPNLETLNLYAAGGKLVPLIPVFLSPRTTAVSIGFSPCTHDHKTMIASVITALPTLCPNLRKISLKSFPRDPAITAAISRMVLASNRNTLRSFRVDFPLAEEASEVIYQLPGLRKLWTVIEEDTSLPSMTLPNLTSLAIECNCDNGLSRVLREATLGKLESVTFDSSSEQVGDPLEAFEKAAHAASAQNTLSRICIHTSHPWNPNYSSLLPYTQVACLAIVFPCHVRCSSTVDDEVIINLARAMPKLKILRLGDRPCGKSPTGVTVKGLVVLAYHCPHLSTLRVHFRVASLSAPPAITEAASNVGSAALRRDCSLKLLNAGEIPILAESVLVVALTLARIFPHIEDIESSDMNWVKVVRAISTSREIIDCSGEDHPLAPPRSTFSVIPPQEPYSKTAVNQETV